jgi:hypothetical protein
MSDVRQNIYQTHQTKKYRSAVLLIVRLSADV